MVATIEGIKKVKFDLFVENVSEAEGSSPLSFEIIFGIGTAGLSDFERSLAGKKVGDSQRIHIPASQAKEYFEHYFAEIWYRLGLQIVPAEMVFLVEVKGIADVGDREVVKALAQGGGHGCGGSCGCGCG